MRNVLLSCGAMFAVGFLAACSGSSGGPFISATSSPPGAGAPASVYVGTFPLTYTGISGLCNPSALPTALQITGTSQSTDANGNATTQFTGMFINGASASLPFANPGTPGTASDELPGAYIENSTHSLVINVFTGYGAVFTNIETEMITQWNPPKASSGGFVVVKDDVCGIAYGNVSIGAPQ
jgi:hypothetical protein